MKTIFLQSIQPHFARNFRYIALFVVMMLANTADAQMYMKWAKRNQAAPVPMGTTETDRGFSVATDDAEYTYVIGVSGDTTLEDSNGEDVHTDLFLSKFDSEGELVWKRRIRGKPAPGSPGIPYIRPIQNHAVRVKNGSIYIALEISHGSSATYDLQFQTSSSVTPVRREVAYLNYAIVKYDTSGLYRWIQPLDWLAAQPANSVSNQEFSVESIDVDNFNTVFVAGKIKGRCQFSPAVSEESVALKGAAEKQVNLLSAYIARYNDIGNRSDWQWTAFMSFGPLTAASYAGASQSFVSCANPGWTAADWPVALDVTNINVEGANVYLLGSYVGELQELQHLQSGSPVTKNVGPTSFYGINGTASCNAASVAAFYEGCTNASNTQIGGNYLNGVHGFETGLPLTTGDNLVTYYESIYYPSSSGCPSAIAGCANNASTPTANNNIVNTTTDPPTGGQLRKRPSRDVFLAKFNINGEFHSTKDWGGSDEDYSQDMTVDGSDIYIAMKYDYEDPLTVSGNEKSVTLPVPYCYTFYFYNWFTGQIYQYTYCFTPWWSANTCVNTAAEYHRYRLDAPTKVYTPTLKTFTNAPWMNFLVKTTMDDGQNTGKDFWGHNIKGDLENILIDLDRDKNIAVAGSYKTTTDAAQQGIHVYVSPFDGLNSPPLRTSVVPNANFLDAYALKFEADGTYERAMSYGSGANDLVLGLSTNRNDLIVTGGFGENVDFQPAPGQNYSLLSVGKEDAIIARYGCPGIKLVTNTPIVCEGVPTTFTAETDCLNGNCNLTYECLPLIS